MKSVPAHRPRGRARPEVQPREESPARGQIRRAAARSKPARPVGHRTTSRRSAARSASSRAILGARKTRPACPPSSRPRGGVLRGDGAPSVARDVGDGRVARAARQRARPALSLRVSRVRRRRRAGARRRALQELRRRAAASRSGAAAADRRRPVARPRRGVRARAAGERPRLPAQVRRRGGGGAAAVVAARGGGAGARARAGGRRPRPGAGPLAQGAAARASTTRGRSPPSSGAGSVSPVRRLCGGPSDEPGVRRAPRAGAQQIRAPSRSVSRAALRPLPPLVDDVVTGRRRAGARARSRRGASRVSLPPPGTAERAQVPAPRISSRSRRRSRTNCWIAFLSSAWMSPKSAVTLMPSAAFSAMRTVHGKSK